MKVKRPKRWSREQVEDQRAAPKYEALCGQGKLRWILSRVRLEQKRLQSLVTSFQYSLRSLNDSGNRDAAFAHLTNLLSKCEPIFCKLGSTLALYHGDTRLTFTSEERYNWWPQLPLGQTITVCCGQHKVTHLVVSTFLYSRPTPYLSQVHTGLFKYIRWNVVNLGTEQNDTEFFFLCFEDVPHSSEGFNWRTWSIGRWVQVKPDPENETIYDWILCEVPESRYERLLVLDDEPTICAATEALCQLLCST